MKRRTPVAKRVTLRDVAAVAGVDPSAVSRVVNDDRNFGISDATRARILDAVEQLGYRPNLAARGLRQSRTATICFVIPNIGNPMYESMVHAVVAAAEKRGYSVILDSHVDGRPPRALASLLQDARADGLLVASASLHDDFIRAAVDHQPGPIVLVNRRVDGVPNSVILDDEAAGHTAVGYLVGLGHRRIAGVFGPPDIDTAVRRRRGFEQACRAAGIEPVVRQCAGWSAEHGHAGLTDVLTGRPDVTAVYASTLLLGVGALKAAHDLGRDVPADLSVISLHDSPLAEYLVPALTTIRMPMEELGVAAVNLLVELTEGGPDQAVVIAGAGEVVVRGSTARVNSND